MLRVFRYAPLEEGSISGLMHPQPAVEKERDVWGPSGPTNELLLKTQLCLFSRKTEAKEKNIHVSAQTHTQTVNWLPSTKALLC